jgi:hypothetical protein
MRQPRTGWDGVVLVLERLAIRKLTAKTGVESRERPLGERPVT